jgi:hypothetical protein
MSRKRDIKIFLTSPGDVLDARAEAVRRIVTLNRDPEIAAAFRLRVLRWEDAPPVIGWEPQEVVNNYMGRTREADIVVSIFGQRFGTEVRMPGRSSPSGTFYEFDTAVQARRLNRAGKPVILLYRMLRETPPDAGSEDEKPFAQVEEFFKNFQRHHAVYRGLYKSFREVEEFGAALARDLKQVIFREFAGRKGEPKLRLLLNRLGFGIDYEEYREKMITRVREDWIEGVLNDMTGRRAPAVDIEVRAYGAPDLSLEPEPTATSGERMFALFDRAEEQLLILGKPGAGKTFQMLELVAVLLVRAEEDPSAPIPVVFNLSSWAYRGERMKDWLISQLESVYHLPRKLAQTWVEGEKLTLCLDGLDEITVGGAERDSELSEMAQRSRVRCRRECLLALNNYIEKKSVPLVLCCREEDFAALGMRLLTHRGDYSTIWVKPLSDAKVEAYLAAERPHLSSLRKAIAIDDGLRQMARTPFLLSTMAIAYRDLRTDVILAGGEGDEKARRDHLFRKYFNARYDSAERALKERYKPDELNKYLGELAWKIEEGNSNLIFVEQLQPDRAWLGRSGYLLYVAFVALLLLLFIGVLVGIPAGWAIGYELAAPGPLAERLMHFDFECMLLTTLCCGTIMIAGFTLTKSWGFGVACGVTLGVGRMFVISMGAHNPGDWLLQGLTTIAVGVPILVWVMKARGHARDHIRPFERWKWNLKGALLGVAMAVAAGAALTVFLDRTRGSGFGLALVIILALAFGYRRTDLEPKTYPNQGLRRSATNALRVVVLSASAGAFCFGVVFRAGEGPEMGIINIILGLSLGVTSLVFGGMPLMQHVSLRLALALRDLAPLDLVTFLDAASDMHLLRKVGGGFMFQHEYLRYYFRDWLRPKTTRAPDSTGPTASHRLKSAA